MVIVSKMARKKYIMKIIISAERPDIIFALKKKKLFHLFTSNAVILFLK